MQKHVSKVSTGVTWLDGPSLLFLLISIDLGFIIAHAWLLAQGSLIPQFNIESDRSIPEWFSYAKWASCGIACAFAFGKRRQPLYLIWSLLFLYFLVDDSLRLHEQLGGELAAIFGFVPALALRSQDFGELALSLAVAFILFGAMAALYWQAGPTSRESTDFTRRQLPALGLLIFFGILVDMFHIQALMLDSSYVKHFLGLVEDGGEMIAASILTATSIRQAAMISESLQPQQHTD